MSKSDDDFVCPDCVGDGEVQCVNLGPTYRSDTLPCPTCIAHEIEQERASKADEITRLTAENEKLRDVLSGVLWMAEEWFNHGGDETAFSDDHAAKLEAARAILSASQPAPSPWRLIETAPTDGTVVLVFAAERDGLPAFQCTAAYHEDAGWCVDELREVTHWMPLPPPPQKENTND